MESLGPVVAARGLRKDFDGRPVLDGLDLEVRAGEVFGFLGPNGAGKTTTIRILLGLMRPTAGTVHLFGETLDSNRPGLMRRIGAMVEAPAFYPYLSGRDNLRVLALMGGVPEGRVDEVLQVAGLGEAGRRKFGDYSVGMKQRLGLAAALLRDPDLLILDEPTAGLDPDGQRSVRELFPSLRARGTTVLRSSHALPEVADVCDAVGILKDGRLAAAGPVAGLLRPETEVEVRALEPGRIATAIGHQPWVAGVRPAGEWVVVTVTEGHAHRVNGTLVEAGIVAFEVRIRERTLDAVYHEVVHGVAA